jgi:uncharacterized protein (TIGR00369 family)
MDQAETMQQRIKGFFPDLLGIRFVEATPDRVLAELDVRDDLCTVPGILHGGAMMAFADTLGAVATVLNIPENARTTTLESKTNFFGPGRGGTTISAETLPLHRGKRTMVWQTSIRSPEGKLLAQVTQTQYVDIPS